jgi:hypothetical protein
MNQVLSPISLIALVALSVLPGCSTSKGPPVVPVSGKVTVGGQPVTSGQVLFVPAEASKAEAGGKESQMSAGQIDSNGTYTIHTGGKSGAPVGKYKVVVTPSMVPTGDSKSMPATPFNRSYSNVSTTPLTKEVVASPQPGAYDLDLKK